MRSRPAGFTLVELLIAILLVGIVLAFVYPKLLPVKESTYTDLMKNSIRNLAFAEAQHFQAHSTWTADLDVLRDEFGYVEDRDVLVVVTFPGSDPTNGLTITAIHSKTAEVCELRRAPGATDNPGIVCSTP